ncbi:MAG: hypothetical protein ACJ0F5_03180 [Candidatus Actinomarina sp.]|tara:strand:+ start:1246 stop:2628 length:1383 start_codon:yes stop_codon:yes gene_type:complete
MELNKQSRVKSYEIVFLGGSVLLVFLDAYQIFGIPIPWIGMTILLLFALNKYKIFYNAKNFVIISILFAVVMIPQVIYIFFNELSQGDIRYLFLRLLNIFSFVIVLLFSLDYFDKEKISSFLKNSKYLIGAMSVLTIYIFIAQIFDLNEFVRNRSNTNLFGDSEQSTFWLSQPHRAMGTFREPVLLISFLMPLIVLYLYKYKNNNYLISIISGVALGLSRSNYLRLFCIMFLFFVLFNYLKIKEINKSLVLFLLVSLIMSNFGVLECNLNSDSRQCVEYEEDVQKMNASGQIKIDTSISRSELDLGTERLNVLSFSINSLRDITPKTIINVNSDYQDYSSVTVNEEMYFTNRTLPKYLLQRYSTQNFGTGNYYLLKYDLNVQNLFVFYTQAFGIIFSLILFLIFLNLIVQKKDLVNLIFFFFFLLFFFVSPVEEVNAFYGLIIGVAYNLIFTKEEIYGNI